MCVTLFDNEYLLDNEYQLKVALKDMNDKYMILVQQRDQYRSNVVSIKQELVASQKELSQIKSRYVKQMENHKQNTQKMNDMTKQLNEVAIESQSYKNVLQTYNVMSPSNHSSQQHINNLCSENKKLMQQIKAMESEKQKLNRNLEEIEIENAKLSQRVNNGEYNSLTTKVLSFKNNPLKLAMDREKHLRNEEKEKIRELETQLQVMQQKKEKKTATVPRNASALYYELENKYNILIKKMSIKEEEMAQGKEELAIANKINQRMKSLFGKKAAEYRERIYQMTGYNICLLGDAKHYRLQHLWMDHQDDEIVLQIDKLGQLQLKDTEFMRSKMDKGLITKLKH
eukprot:84751_1